MLPTPINPGIGLVLLAFWMESRIKRGLFVDVEEVEKARDFAAATGVLGFLLIVQGAVSKAIWGTYLFFSR